MISRSWVLTGVGCTLDNLAQLDLGGVDDIRSARIDSDSLGYGCFFASSPPSPLSSSSSSSSSPSLGNGYDVAAAAAAAVNDDDHPFVS